MTELHNSCSIIVHQPAFSSIVAAPKVSLVPSGSSYLSVAYGGDIEAICNATGYPEPKVTWHKVDGGILQTESTSGSSSVLQISSAEGRDSGLYKCQATNGVGKSEASLLIFVKGNYL